MLTWFSELNLVTQILLIYLLLINLLTFFYFGIDKLKAQLSRRRIRETTLWIITLLGGSLGTLLGMKYFRHKTRKQSFQAVVAIILAVQIMLIYFSIK